MLFFYDTVGIHFNRVDSSTIGLSWSISKRASSIYVSAYHNNNFLASRTFDGNTREISLTNATPSVVYTVNIQARYTDSTSATGSKNVWTS